MIRILVVDDQKMIREALKTWLESEIDFQIIGTADNGIAAVEQVERLQPDVVLMNIEMPGLDGASATQFIANKYTNTKVLILSSEDSDEYVAKSLSVGARGYLLKDSESQDIAAAIRSVYRGYTQIGPGLLDKVLVQTDSGLIISKLKNPNFLPQITQSNSDEPLKLSRERQFIARTKKAIINLQSMSRQYNIEFKKINNNLGQIKPELAQITKIATKNSQQIWLTWIFLLTSIALIFFTLLNLHNRAKNLEKNTIPIERIGLYGEYNLSGLAQRVATTFKKDFMLSDISTVYVAQKGSTIVLEGAIADDTMLKRMKNLARDVKGVTKVDTQKVNVISLRKIETK
jgi:DNA-binding NarL/FixJ family response regulator